MIRAETGEYPAGGRSQSDASIGTGVQTTFPGFTFTVSKQAYSTATSNFSYCTNGLGSTPTYVIVAKSKSGKVFRYSSMNGLQAVGEGAVGPTAACAGMAYPLSWSYGYYQGSASWFSWTD